MDYVGRSAHTAHGIGEIVDTDSVRGRRSFRVAGRNFNVWVDETNLHLASGDPEFSDAPHHQHETEGHWDAHEGGEDPNNYPHFYGSLDSTIEQGPVNDDNSTVLPYNPTPQHSVEMFRDEQTMQPGDYEIDPDDRLHSSDSLTGNDRQPNRPYPGPNPDLFAKSAAFGEEPGWGWQEDPPRHLLHHPKHSEEPDMDDAFVGGDPRAYGGGSQAQLYGYASLHHSTFEDLDKDAPQWGEDRWHADLPDGPDRTFGKEAGAHDSPYTRWQSGGPGAHEPAEHHAPDTHQVGMGDDEFDAYMADDPSYSGGRHETYNMPKGEGAPGGYGDHRFAGPAGLLSGGESENPSEGGGSGMNPGKVPIAYPSGPVQGGVNQSTGLPGLSIPSKGAFGQMDSRVSNYRPAGLSNRYAHFDIEAHDGMDPVSQFRRDPEGFLHTAGYIQSGDGDYLTDKYAAYTSLLATDPQMHTAALQEMQSKALHMARTGSVLVRDANAHGVYASVTDPDDGNTYDTLLTKAGSWQCGCEWGRWAFHHGAVHMCPHAYAAYGSTRTADVVDRFKTWAKEQNDNHIDEASIDSFLNQDDEDATAEDVDKLYKHVLDNPDEQPERNYDVGYELDPEKSYKEASQWDEATPEEEAHWAQQEKQQGQEFQHEHQRTADALRMRPRSMTPDLRVVPKEDEEWLDVTKDERETTGPDQIMKGAGYAPEHALQRGWEPSIPPPNKKGKPFIGWTDGGQHEDDHDDLVHFSAVLAKLHHADMQSVTDNGQQALDADREVGMPTPSSNLVASLHQADSFVNGEPQDDSQATGNPFSGLVDQFKHRMEPGDYTKSHPMNSNGEPIQQAAPPAAQQSTGVDMSGVEGLGKGSDGNLSVEDYNKGAQGAGAQQAELAGATTPVGGAGHPGAGSNTPDNSYWKIPSKGFDPAGANSAEAIKNTQGNSGAGAGAGGAMGTGGGYGGAGFQSGGGDWLKSNETTKINTGPNAQYTVKPGDTLQAISDRSGIAVNDLAKQNNIADPNSINSGQQLKLPGGGSPAAPPPTSSPSAGHQETVSMPGKAPGPGPVGTPPPIPQTPPLPKPPMPSEMGKKGRRHLAEQSDAQLLDKLRDMSADTPADSLGHMDSRNDKLRDLVDELQNERGMDVSFMVAHLIEADSPSDGNPDFEGVSAPADPDKDFQGSGPNPRDWFSDSASYVDSQERPHIEDDWTEGDGDIIKFNDGRSAPQQGPRTGARDHIDPLGGLGGEETLRGKMQEHLNNARHWEEHLKDRLRGSTGISAAHYADFDTPPSMGGVEGMPANEYGDPEDAMGQGQSMVSSLHRVGGGPRQQVRVDPGFRGHQQPRHAAAPPEDFGYDGDIAPPSGGDESTDIVASFQRSGAAGAIFGESQSSANDDIAGAAQHFLRTAGRKFTPDEQRVLEAENHPLGARNLPTDDDLAGTHYLLGL
jgi:LysM repeat protein